MYELLKCKLEIFNQIVGCLNVLNYLNLLMFSFANSIKYARFIEIVKKFNVQLKIHDMPDIVVVYKNDFHCGRE